MMTNLFSIFDSATNLYLDFNWISSIMILFLFPMTYWLFNSKWMFMFTFITKYLITEMMILLKNKFNFINNIIFISIFFMVFSNNLMGLFPYIFTSSSHMIFSLSFTLPIWLTIMIYGWLNNYNFLFSHMIPLGTPQILMPFMVLIETISNIIRPGTLSIRLTANMIAGHLLLTLMSQSALNSNLMISLMIIILQILLITLELSVSMIQAYVLSTLTILYSKEIS